MAYNGYVGYAQILLYAQILGTPSISYYPHPNEYLCQVSECDHDLNDLPKICALAALLILIFIIHVFVLQTFSTSIGMMVGTRMWVGPSLHWEIYVSPKYYFD